MLHQGFWIRFWMKATLLSFMAIGWTTAQAENDVAASLYGAFSGATSGNNVQQSPSNAAGVLFELRHISNPLMGYEGTYSYNRANQTYASCGTINPLCQKQSISANAHEITGDWLVSVHVANIRPFALGGIGVLFNEPAGSQTDTTSSDKAVFVYGAGLDWGVLPHIGVRVQYRGNVYKAPDVTRAFSSTGAFTHTAEPMIGAYLRF
jgi:opacity protein-like surface antigen